MQSGGEALVAMVQPTDLRDRDDAAAPCWLDGTRNNVLNHSSRSGSFRVYAARSNTTISTKRTIFLRSRIF